MMWSRDGTELARPWFYVGKIPMHSVTLLVATFSVSMVVMTLLLAAGMASAVSALVLNQDGVFSGQVWRLISWPWVNFPDIWFVISMIFLYLFGRDIERTLGRVDFFKLASVIAAVVAVLTLLLPGARLAGSWYISFGLFLAFAIMNPSALIIPCFNITAKWWAILMLALNALMAVGSRDWGGLAQLAGMTAAAAVGLKWLGAAASLPWLVLPTVRFASKSQPSHKASSSPSISPVRATQARLDELLDKVAAQGLHSLTDEERRFLSHASETLQRRK